MRVLRAGDAPRQKRGVRVEGRNGVQLARGRVQQEQQKQHQLWWQSASGSQQQSMPHIKDVALMVGSAACDAWRLQGCGAGSPASSRLRLLPG